MHAYRPRDFDLPCLVIFEWCLGHHCAWLLEGRCEECREERSTVGAPIQRTSSLDSTESEEGESDGRSGPEGVEVYVAGLRIDSKTLATEMHSWAHTEFSSFESDIRDASSAREPLQRLHRALHKQCHMLSGLSAPEKVLADADRVNQKIASYLSDTECLAEFIKHTAAHQRRFGGHVAFFQFRSHPGSLHALQQLKDSRHVPAGTPLLSPSKKAKPRTTGFALDNATYRNFGSSTAMHYEGLLDAHELLRNTIDSIARRASAFIKQELPTRLSRIQAHRKKLRRTCREFKHAVAQLERVWHQCCVSVLSGNSAPPMRQLALTRAQHAARAALDEASTSDRAFADLEHRGESREMTLKTLRASIPRDRFLRLESKSLKRLGMHTLFSYPELQAVAQLCRLKKRATLIACSNLVADCDELVARRLDIVDLITDSWQHALDVLASETERVVSTVDLRPYWQLRVVFC
eukprot:INCI5063.11.p1 GENE.INCI5063.11~~INCI5063.11.p1  ORF type:complete len:465 (+),score=60.93 INCI5063.11:108-1502(+)